MAKKFFNNKVNSRKKNMINYIIIGVCVIGIAACFFFTQYYNFGSSNNPKIKLQKSVSLELFSKEPDYDIFFASLSDVDDKDIEVDYSNVDFDKLGKYTVNLKIKKEKYEVELEIVDATSPKLILKELNIKENDKYNAMDFVESCSDNSKEECNISFHSSSVNEDGTTSDFTNYKKPGEYFISIEAKDASGNSTFKTTNLIIGNNQEKPQEVTCSYGIAEYDTENYSLTYNVSQNNCAISLDSYLNENIQKPINTIAETETKKIKTEVDKIKNLDSSLHIFRNINAITNKTGNGFVGYSLMISVQNDDGDIIVSYYLNENGDRVYLENPHNIK